MAIPGPRGLIMLYTVLNVYAFFLSKKFYGIFNRVLQGSVLGENWNFGAGVEEVVVKHFDHFSGLT